MPTDRPFDPQEPYELSDEERGVITGRLSTWMSPEKMKSEIQAVEKRAGWTVQTSPKFKSVREASHAVQIAESFKAAELRMNDDGCDWPDFWMRLDNQDIPCELTTIHNPDQTEIGIPIHRDDAGDLIIDFNTDYSDWPEDQFIRGIPHAGRWRNEVGKAFRSGQEAPFGAWPEAENLRGLPVWTEAEVRKKNEKAKGQNYIEGTVLVVVAEFEVKVAMPRKVLEQIGEAMMLGTAFRAVVVYVPDAMAGVWPNPEFPPFAWRPTLPLR